jgi:hypothetical protein
MPSDLEFVAEAIELSNGTGVATPPNTITTQSRDLPEDIALAVATLSAADRAAIQPLLSALSSDPETGLEELLRQMDSASSVADSLESRLDNLLGALGQAQSELEAKDGGEKEDKMEALGEEERRAFGATDQEVEKASEVIHNRKATDEA